MKIHLRCGQSNRNKRGDCIPCMKEWRNKWEEANKERHSATTAAWRKRNVDRHKTYQAAWRKANCKSWEIEMKKMIGLLKEEKKARIKAEKEIVRQFPIGAIVEFEKGGHWINAEVIMHCSPRLKVRNTETLKEYWIEISLYLFECKKIRRV